MNRRSVLMAGAAPLAMLGQAGARSVPAVTLILAPTSLGLRPLADGAEPGAWQAPDALMEAGLKPALGGPPVIKLSKPAYRTAGEAGTRLRNGHGIRDHSLKVAAQVHETLKRGGVPVVIGGDCSILLGCLLGLRRAGGRGLLHVDGHSDFFHPGNYNTMTRLGSVAGMDLALATGRGEPLLTKWADIAGPLVEDTDTIQAGERDANAPGYAYRDIEDTKITRILIEDLLTDGVARTVARILARLEARSLDRLWLHVDLDVLDERVMPAVDSPGTPGLNFEQLAALVNGVIRSGRIAGIDFTIYDPDRDPERAYARPIVQCIAAGLSSLSAQRPFP